MRFMRWGYFILLAALLLTVFTGCGEDTSENSVDKITETALTPGEPAEDSLCSFCNMKVYTKEEALGVSTAQAVTDDGEQLFFDDSGCLLNWSRKTGETYEAEWVRDTVSNEWIETDKSTVVHSDAATPMKYGFFFFSSEKAANEYIAEHANENAELSSWDAIEAMSSERYEMKMQKESEAHTDSSEQEKGSHQD